MDFGFFGAATAGMPGSTGLPAPGFVGPALPPGGSGFFATAGSGFFEPGPAIKYQTPPAAAASANSTSAPASKRDFFPGPFWGHAAASAGEGCGTTGDANADLNGGAELPMATSGGRGGPRQTAASAPAPLPRSGFSPPCRASDLKP